MTGAVALSSAIPVGFPWIGRSLPTLWIPPGVGCPGLSWQCCPRKFLWAAVPQLILAAQHSCSVFHLSPLTEKVGEGLYPRRNLLKGPLGKRPIRNRGGMGSARGICFRQGRAASKLSCPWEVTQLPWNSCQQGADSMGSSPKMLLLGSSDIWSRRRAHISHKRGFIVRLCRFSRVSGLVTVPKVRQLCSHMCS